MAGTTQAQDRIRDGARFVLLLLGCFIVFLIVRRAWVSDDAYITLRTIANFLTGHGLVYNPGERVQAYTHPLWLIVLTISTVITWEFFYTPIVVSVALAVSTLIVLARRVAVSSGGALLAFGLLALSKSFIEYSTSGLENVLSFFLLAWFYAEFFDDRPTADRIPRLALIATLGVLNRLDNVLLFGPPMLYQLWLERGRFNWRRVGLMALPLLIWELFSLFYYGFALPNSAYAKAFTGFPHRWLWEQGCFYFLNSIKLDPVTLFVTGLGIAAAITKRDRALRSVAGGSFLYLLYIVHIGGDFMSGRFFGAPMLAAIVILARLELAWWARACAFAVALAIGFPTLLELAKTGYAHPTYSEDYIDQNGIADERAFYHGVSGLDHASRDLSLKRYSGADAEGPREVIPYKAIGIAGFNAGASVYILDKYALADPLLARLPARRTIFWRVGHFERRIPDGYVETLRSGKNRIADRDLAEYYDHLCRLTRGPLLSAGRLGEIARFNFGFYNDLINREFYGSPYTFMVDVPVKQTPLPVIAWNSRGNQMIPPRDGIFIRLEKPAFASQAQLALDGNHQFGVEVFSGNAAVARVMIPAAPARGFAARTIDLPREAWAGGIDAVRVRPISGEGDAIFGGMAVGLPNMLVIEPNGGQKIRAGGELTVVWQTRPDIAGRDARFELWRAGRRVAVLGASGNALLPVPVTNRFTVPDVAPGADYRLRAISLRDEKIQDESDGDLEVVTK
ncbi:hypothetical protein LLG95_09690 [bacterium]|nr:hypothetical protein [bacterium]